MHLWPSLRIRDSFRTSYLKKLEWNLHRMNSEKQQQQTQNNDQQQQPLLVGNQNQRDGISEAPCSKNPLFASGFVAVCSEILMVLSCCYCCFCCGACIDQEED